MPLKEGACRVCNDTKKCSVCGGTGISKKDKDTCKGCKGSGKCKHCEYEEHYWPGPW
ncbi:hypothetical protein KKA24_01405 [Patescibacteria group bacterium]|nr:hypothetical protein [Patescibacteria group bacterium]